MDSNLNIETPEITTIKKESKLKKYLHRLWVSFLIMFILLMIITLIRLPTFLQKEATKDIIIKINNTKLTLDDVLGKNLPPEPNPEVKDATLEGVDVNKNGIRDDVELAIFKEYPHSAKMRAQLLQYAQSLQITALVPFVNEEIATFWEEKSSTASYCLTSTIPKVDLKEFFRKKDELINFVEEKQFNTYERKKREQDFYKMARTSGDLGNECDIDLSILPN